jgi:hypothetical protein
MKHKLVLLPVSFALLSLACSGVLVFADQISTTGGDQFNGKVLSLSNEVVVIQSDALGQISIPRSKVASISMTSATGVALKSTLPVSTNRPAQTVVSAAPPVTDLSAAIKQLSSDPAAAKQVQDQYLSSSDAATKAKYNELLSGLQSGQLNADGLRAQAQSAVDQLKSYK